MKKLLLITVAISIILSACQKSQSLKASATFLPGNWVRTKIVDSLYYPDGKFFGANNYNVSINQNTIVFGANGTGTSTTRGDFSYSATDYTLIFTSIPDATWHIKSVTTNSFILKATTSDGAQVTTDYYSKQ